MNLSFSNPTKTHHYLILSLAIVNTEYSMASPNVVHVNKENVAPVPSRFVLYRIFELTNYLPIHGNSNSTLHGNSAVCICLLTGPDSTNLKIQVQGYAPQVLKNNILPVVYVIHFLVSKGSLSDRIAQCGRRDGHRKDNSTCRQSL
jgi:hypothetical protein